MVSSRNFTGVKMVAKNKDLTCSCENGLLCTDYLYSSQKDQNHHQEIFN